MSSEQRWNGADRGKPNYSEKNLSQYQSAHQNSQVNLLWIKSFSVKKFSNLFLFSVAAQASRIEQFCCPWMVTCNINKQITMQYNLNSTVHIYFYSNVFLNDAFNCNNNTHSTARIRCGLPLVPILLIWPA